MTRANDPHGIKARLAAAGRTQAELAEFLDMKIDATNRLINGSRRMQSADAELIESFFGGARRQAPAGRIPVFGYAAAGGDDRIAWADDTVLETLEPPILQGGLRPDAAVRVIGDSMEPRLYAGERVYVRFNVPPARGQDCIVELLNGQAMVKTYEGGRDGVIFLRQFNPDRQVTVARSQVRAIHAIVARD
jgi:phage repressor protein C with HTH and peptisase S24 domain